MTEHTVIHSDTDQSVTEAEARLLLELGWIEVNEEAEPLEGEVLYAITDQGISYGGDDVDSLVALAHEDFPDVAAALVVQPAPFKNVRPEPGDVEESDFMATLLSILPDAEVDMDSDGQITINTGLFAIGGRQALRGRFIKPQPAIGPAPEGYTRVMVLDDGETFSGLSGCQIKDVIDEDLQDVDDLDNLDPDTWSFVASFNADGLEV